MATTGKKKAPTLFIELVDQRDSGYVLDGTANTSHEVRLTAPKVRFICNRGYRAVQIQNPDGTKDFVNEPIRYIQNTHIISVAEQDRLGIRPAKNRLQDLISVENGNFSVTREGKFIGLYDYLLESFYNVENENRSETAEDIYRVIIPGQKEEAFNISEFAAAKAIQYLEGLVNITKKGYEYSESKIDALCGLFRVHAETPSGKLQGLIAHAKVNPSLFLDKVLKMDQTLHLDIAHSIELGVISIDKQTVYLGMGDKKKLVISLGTKKMKHEDIIQGLADHFANPENVGIYSQFKVELEAAKERKL